MIYGLGFVLTFAYFVWPSACRNQASDTLEWILFILFSAAWPITWVVVFLAWCEAKGKRG